MDKKLSGLEVSMDKKLSGLEISMDKKLSGLEVSMDKKLSGLEGRVGLLIDQRLLVFHEKVTIPMADGMVDDVRSDMSKMESRLVERLDTLENNSSKIERKLDNISDHHSARIDNHEKRISGLEKKVIVSL